MLSGGTRLRGLCSFGVGYVFGLPIRHGAISDLFLVTLTIIS